MFVLTYPDATMEEVNVEYLFPIPVAHMCSTPVM